MFTGIIQNQGIVRRVTLGRSSATIQFKFKRAEKKVAVGESIAVNGACLTATKINTVGFSADLLPETLQATNLGKLKKGEWVNLERSLRAGDAIGGHFITGHVDAVGSLLKIERRGRNWSLLVGAPKTIISKLAVKGSVALDGVSLTVQAVQAQSFRTAIIPHTLEATNLSRKHSGSPVNLEIDILMRYLERIKMESPRLKMSVRELKQQGF